MSGYYESELARNPYNLRTWLAFLNTEKNSMPINRFVVYERAVKHLPRSYKLWVAYLTDLSTRLKGKKVTDKRCMGLKNTFERALVHMNKMPRIWYVLGVYNLSMM